MHLDPRAPRSDRHTSESLAAVSEHSETEESCRRNSQIWSTVHDLSN